MSELEPVLLLHGQPGGAHDWDLVIDALDGAVTSIALERPGNGNRLRPGGIERSGRAGVAALDRLGIARATVVGVSYGGAVAAWIAAQHPERVSSLVLVSPAANLESLVAFDRVLALPTLGPLLSGMLLAGAGVVAQLPKIRERVARAWGISEPYLRRTGMRLLSLRTLTTFNVEQTALLRELPELEASLQLIQAPTTIMVGDHDTVVPVTANLRLARQIAGARLVHIPDGRHTLCITHPEAVAAAILAAVPAAG